MLADLPELCIQNVANYLAAIDVNTESPVLSHIVCFPFRNENDVIRDVIALAASNKSVGRAFAPWISAKCDPPSPSETVCDEVLDDTTTHVRAKPGVTIARLKEACKTAGLKVSGNKEQLVTRLHEEVRKKICRDPYTHLSKDRVRASRSMYTRFSRIFVRDVEFAYALDEGTLRGSVSRTKAYSAAIAKYRDAYTLRRELRRREDLRKETRETRRKELADALRFRRSWLVIRNDSAICTQYIEGNADALPLERVVDVVEEMHFLYQRTQYPSILRSLRAASREMDRDFGDGNYWRKRDMVKDGLIESIDEDTPSDCSDEYDDYNEREEEQRRNTAKRRAVNAWLKNPTSDRSLLPRTLQ